MNRDQKKYRYVGKDIDLDFGEWDHFRNEEDYWNFIKERFKETARVLKLKGHLVTFFDQSRASYLIDYVKTVNLMMRQHLYWLKTNPLPRARKVDFMVALEQALWFTKGTKSGATFNYKLGQQVNYVEASIPGHTTKEDGERIHPTQKPCKVIEVWMAYLSNEDEWVLDPFAGSGTVGIISAKLNRNSILVDISKEYCESAYARLRKYTRQTKITGEQNIIERVGF